LFELSIILIVATAGALLARWLKQPLIPAYIISGIILGPILHLITDVELISVYAEIGIAFLLFIVGLELDVARIKSIGLVASLGGLIQVVLTFIIAFAVTSYLGLDALQASYMGLVIAFSSTFVVIKLLGDKREIDTLHGRIVIGILLIQDIIAVLALSVIETIDVLSWTVVIAALLKGASLFLASAVISRYIAPRLFNFAAKSNELLFLCSLATMFAFAMFAELIGYSIAIGGFLAGLTLANLPYHGEIIGRVKPLRDFFATLFFVSLGLQFIPFDVSRVWLPLVLVVGLVIVVKPFILLLIGNGFGYSSRTSFIAAVSMAQVSEFSLIMLQMGVDFGHVAQELFSFVVLTTIITIAVSSYFIKYDRWIFARIGWLIRPLEGLGGGYREPHHVPHRSFDALLVGCDRAGSSVLKELKRQGRKVLVVDFNPEVVRRLVEKHISCVFGDVSDPEFLSDLDLKPLRIIVSTSHEFGVNKEIVRYIKKRKKECMVLVTANTAEEALQLYKRGADYVVLPQMLGGDHVAMMLKHRVHDISDLRCLRHAHMRGLLERVAQ